MKLLLADDHTLFRDALVQYIKRADAASEVSVAKDLDEAKALMQVDPHQELVILDLRMPGMKGLQGFKEMREEYPEVPMALMSGVAEEHDVEAALDMGAVGYFPKTLSGKALLQAIQFVLSGEKFVPIDKLTNKTMPAYYGDIDNKPKASTVSKNPDEFKLTPREKEVLEYLARGDANKEIANALDLQVVTVKLHVRSICQKLGVQNRTQAAIKAKETGLVE